MAFTCFMTLFYETPCADQTIGQPHCANMARALEVARPTGRMDSVKKGVHVTQLPSYEQFLDQHPDLWPRLDREDAYEVFCEEIRDRDRQEAHEAAEEAAERAEIMKRCLEEAEADDRARRPEFNVSAKVSNPYDESEDADADEGVFHG